MSTVIQRKKRRDTQLETPYSSVLKDENTAPTYHENPSRWSRQQSIGIRHCVGAKGERLSFSARKPAASIGQGNPSPYDADSFAFRETKLRLAVAGRKHKL